MFGCSCRQPFRVQPPVFVEASMFEVCAAGWDVVLPAPPPHVPVFADEVCDVVVAPYPHEPYPASVLVFHEFPSVTFEIERLEQLNIVVDLEDEVGGDVGEQVVEVRAEPTTRAWDDSNLTRLNVVGGEQVVRRHDAICADEVGDAPTVVEVLAQAKYRVAHECVAVYAAFRVSVRWDADGDGW